VCCFPFVHSFPLSSPSGVFVSYQGVEDASLRTTSL
jgi:hypothetical protein